jgi:HAD superfamily hydrolase (TIGR01509 family)
MLEAVISRISAIIFDMDGVLVDSEAYKAESYKQALSKYKVCNGDEWYYQNLGPSGMTLAIKAINDFNLDINPEKLRDERKAIYQEMLRISSPPPIQTSVDFARRISGKGLRVGVASSETPENIRTHLTNLELLTCFNAITSGSEIKNNKPAPDIYLLASQRLGVAPESCLAIEDTTAGINAANQAGMYCVALSRNHNQDQDLSQADLVVKDLSELDSLFISESCHRGLA